MWPEVAAHESGVRLWLSVASAKEDAILSEVVYFQYVAVASRFRFSSLKKGNTRVSVEYF